MLNKNIVFESKNLYYTKVDKSLIKDYLKMMNDYNVNKYLSLRERVFDYEDELLWVKRNLENDNIAYSVIEKNSNEFVGNIEVLDIKDNTAIIGLAITKNKQGMHFGTEILKSFMNYCFTELSFDEIDATVFSYNEKAINLLLKIGFIEYKRVKNIGKIEYQDIDDIYMKYYRR